MAGISDAPALLYPLSDLPLSFNDSSFAGSEPAPKRHAACDECRKRKLRCSGELTGCSRCVKQALFCHYSIQKQMGRPPKKKSRLEDDGNSMDVSDSVGLGDLESNPLDSRTSRADTKSSTEAFHLCAPVFRAVISRGSQAPYNALSGDQGGLFQQDGSTMLEPVIASDSPWPDYTAAAAASSLMLPRNSDSADKQFDSGMTSNFSLPQGIPRCTCLSYLYLCLSNLSTLTSFPTTNQTILSLYTAARTAREVIRCEICPQQYSTGVQNVMLLGTLLNILADSWLRVSEADPVELGKQSAPAGYVSTVSRDPRNEASSWREWLMQTIRHAVIGGPIEPAASIKPKDTPDVLSLIKEMETRQRRWHAEGTSPSEIRGYSNQQSEGWASTEQNGCSPLKPNGDIDERNLLCLQIVGRAREVISKFGFQPHDYPDGVVA
ncbi:transcriptional regulator family: Fungal Specific TF [Paecilomyces variotii]|nr:transcriptional regulator family: Fungal Specific TF [Paecilomyces variotii]